MITIKQNGYAHYYGACPECNAIFEFDKTDIIDDKVWCPQCGTNTQTKFVVKEHTEAKKREVEMLRQMMTMNAMNIFPKIKNEEIDVEQNEERKHKKVWEKLELKKSR